MAVSLNREVPGRIEWFGEPIAFRCVPARHTGAFADRVKAATTDVELAELLAELVVWIDIADDDDQLIECTGDSFHRLLPAPVLKDLWVAIGELSRPNPPKGSS